MAYKLGKFLVRLEDGAQIPIDTGNRDYIEFLDWVAKGNTPEPDDPPPTPAPRVRLPKLTLVDRLDKAGKLQAAITMLGTDTIPRLRWDASREVDPANPDVRGLLAAVVGADNVDTFLAPETPEEAAL